MAEHFEMIKNLEMIKMNYAYDNNNTILYTGTVPFHYVSVFVKEVFNHIGLFVKNLFTIFNKNIIVFKSFLDFKSLYDLFDYDFTIQFNLYFIGISLVSILIFYFVCIFDDAFNGLLVEKEQLITRVDLLKKNVAKLSEDMKYLLEGMNGEQKKIMEPDFQLFVKKELKRLEREIKKYD